MMTMAGKMTEDERLRRRRIMLSAGALILFLIGCSAAYDLGAKSTCERSGGILLKNYVCIIEDQTDYCRTDDGRFARPYYDMPQISVPGLNRTEEVGR